MPRIDQAASALPTGTVPNPDGRTWHKAAAATGLAFWAVGLLALALLWRADPVQATAAALAIATFYYAGQIGAVPLGLAAGGDPILIGVFVWAADAAGLLVFFPVTQLGVDRLALRSGLFARVVRSLQARARRYEGWVERYGHWGLFGFTMLPFLFNSPILGAIIGRIAGMRSRRTLTALLSAVTIMSVLWTFLFYHALREAAVIDGRLPWVIGLASVAVTLTLALAGAGWRALRRRHAPAPQPDE